jgi:transaldolase
LEHRSRVGGGLSRVTSVASFFVSRVDTKVDGRLPPGSQLRGRVAIANARVAYRQFQSQFSSARWLRLEERGARVQRPLWASTGTKNHDYSDVMYVAELIGPNVVNTMPMGTMRSFRDHGEVERTVDAHDDDAEAVLQDAARAGVDLSGITAELEREGVSAFSDAYERLLTCITEKMAASTR